jgi:hypothetical protein
VAAETNGYRLNLEPPPGLELTLMTTYLTRTLTIAAGLAVLTASAANAAPVSARAVSLTQDPVVMRLSKDEFRIAFGLNAERCATAGCNGVIRYRVDWKTEDGTMRSEIKRVSYAAVPSANRALTVDRQYFDTAEGAHTTDVVRVSVDMITCVDGVESAATHTASAERVRH